MKQTPLKPLDNSWLYVESPDTPMHVAGLMIFELPADAAPDFFQKLLAEAREHQVFYPPWNRRLDNPRLKRMRHSWVEVETVDIDYHVRLSALPWPGGERELGRLIARLHSHALDFRRPPWECHVIQGLENNRFALYVKMHHALIDGVSAMRLLEHVMAKTPDDRSVPAFWAIPPQPRPAPPPLAAVAVDAVGGAFGSLRRKLASVPELAEATLQLLRSAFDAQDPRGAPFKAPASILNQRISGQRRFVTKTFSIERIHAMANAAGCTINDVVLAICGGALRRYLMEAEALPGKSLTVGIPVSVRARDDTGQGNAISFIIATLGTDFADPVSRLAAISTSTRLAKDRLQCLPKDAIESYTMLLMGPYILQLLSGLGGRTRPVFNVTVSNVPGPRQVLYLRGSRMIENYPVSLVTHGQALNITCHGYADTLNFGFLGCRETVPHLQRIAAHAEAALQELEELLI